jgi:hypothetical protein
LFVRPASRPVGPARAKTLNVNFEAAQSQERVLELEAILRSEIACRNDLQDAFRLLAQRRIPRLQAHSAAGSACNEVATLTGDTALRRVVAQRGGCPSKARHKYARSADSHALSADLERNTILMTS